MLIALVAANQLSYGTVIIYLGLLLLFNLRQKNTSDVQVTASLFFFYYFTTNFLLNLFDLVWNYMIKGMTYRHDDDFVSSFSYKTHQLILVTTLAFISG